MLDLDPYHIEITTVQYRTETLSLAPVLVLKQCWGSERFFLDSDSDPVFQTYSDSAPFGGGSESE